MKNLKLFEDFSNSESISNLINEIVELYVKPSDETEFRQAFSEEEYDSTDSSEVTSALLSSLQSIGMGEESVDQEELADTVRRFID